jgi:ADP-heptose:LPS heptosyltransferase
MTLPKPYLINIRSLIFILFDSIALWVTKDLKRNQMKLVLLIRQDAIGDFILWLDTAKEYRKYFPPENYKIVLIGNALWCDLAKELPFWDEVLPINIKAFKTLSRYRWNILRKVLCFGAAMSKLKILSDWKKHIIHRYFQKSLPCCLKHV